MQSETSRVTKSQPQRCIGVSMPTWLGDLTHLEGYSHTIAVSDADELRRHFKIGGLSAFGRSTSAGMLERAKLFAYGTKPCLKCGGHISTADDDPEHGGCGFVPSKSSRCLEVSKRQAEILILLGIDTSSVPMAADVACPDCNCHGWVESPRSHATGQLTARPMGSSVKLEPTAAMMDLDLHTLAICARRLELADALFSLATAAITAFYEPGGCAGMLWHLTPSGKKMLRGNSNNLPPQAYFESVRAAQEQNRDPNKAAQFKAADDQSIDILEAACRAWNAVVTHEDRLTNG